MPCTVNGAGAAAETVLTLEHHRRPRRKMPLTYTLESYSRPHGPISNLGYYTPWRKGCQLQKRAVWWWKGLVLSRALGKPIDRLELAPSWEYSSFGTKEAVFTRGAGGRGVAAPRLPALADFFLIPIVPPRDRHRGKTRGTCSPYFWKIYSGEGRVITCIMLLHAGTLHCRRALDLTCLELKGIIYVRGDADPSPRPFFLDLKTRPVASFAAIP